MLKFNLYRHSRYKYNDYAFKSNPTSNDETIAIFFLCWYQQSWKWHRGGHACLASVLGLTAVVATLNWTLASSWALYRVFLVTQKGKNLPAIWETWVQFLHWEDPLEEGITTYSSILAWRIRMDRRAWWATIHGVTKSQAQLTDQAEHRALYMQFPCFINEHTVILRGRLTFLICLLIFEPDTDPSLRNAKIHTHKQISDLLEPKRCLKSFYLPKSVNSPHMVGLPSSHPRLRLRSCSELV